MYYFLLVAHVVDRPDLGTWDNVLAADRLEDLPPQRLRDEGFIFLRHLPRYEGSDTVCSVYGPVSLKRAAVTVTSRGEATTVPAARVPWLRMWSTQAGLTGLGVLAVELVLRWFR